MPRVPCVSILTGWVLFVQFWLAWAHTRLVCPPSRSPLTGAKAGPCDADDDALQPAYQLQPGLNTVTWEESISHPGAPGRFALSLDGDDSASSFESCLLLDHVPHDDHAQQTHLANQNDAQSPSPLYHQYRITLFIPDVKCTRCHLQLVTYMTDEIHQVPKDTYCANKFALEVGKANASLPACPVVYHSCAAVAINGSIPRNDYTCSLQEFEDQLQWPFMANKPPVNEYFYKGDAGIYNEITHFPSAGGTPIKDCTDFTYCDPSNGQHSTYSLVVPDDAVYARPAGACAPAADIGSTTSTPTGALTVAPTSSMGDDSGSSAMLRAAWLAAAFTFGRFFA